VTGLRIQNLIDRDEEHLKEKRWGVLRASSPNLIIPDRPGPLVIPASPRLLLALDNPDGESPASEITTANETAIRFSRNYVIVPPLEGRVASTSLAAPHIRKFA